MIDKEEAEVYEPTAALGLMVQIIEDAKVLSSNHAALRKFVLDHELMARQDTLEGTRALRRLRRLIQNGFALSLLSFLEPDNDFEVSLSFPSLLRRISVHITSLRQPFLFPVPNGTRNFSEASSKTLETISIIQRNERYKRLRNFRNKYVGHRLEVSRAERSAEAEIKMPTYEDLSRIFLYTLVAVREFSNSVFPMEPDILKFAIEAREDQRKMIKAWNRALGNEVPPV